MRNLRTWYMKFHPLKGIKLLQCLCISNTIEELESHPMGVERWGHFVRFRVADGAFGGEGLVSLNQNWSGQN